jgi:hypothetical protein
VVEGHNITISDLPVMFDYQLDPEANYIAAFATANPADRDAFDADWRRIMIDDTVSIWTNLVDERVAGYVVCYILDDKPEVDLRPIYARAAVDNVAWIECRGSAVGPGNQQ